jgi:hypothetical protein
MWAERNDIFDSTLVELHIEEGSFSTNLPFSGFSGDEEEETDREDEPTAAAEGDDGGPGKGLALLGVSALLVVGTAAVNSRTREEDEPEVTVEADGRSPALTAE